MSQVTIEQIHTLLSLSKKGEISRKEFDKYLEGFRSVDGQRKSEEEKAQWLNNIFRNIPIKEYVKNGWVRARQMQQSTEHGEMNRGQLNESLVERDLSRRDAGGCDTGRRVYGLDTHLLEDHTQEALEKYLEKYPICDELRTAALRLAEEFVEMKPGVGEPYSVAVVATRYSQLRALIKNPLIVGDEVFVPILEKLSVLEECLPVYFTDWEQAEGMGVLQLENLMRAAESETLWGSNNSEVRRIGMSALASGMSSILERHPGMRMESVDVRLDMIVKNEEKESYPEVTSELVYSLISAAEREYVKKYCQNDIPEKGRKVLSEVLRVGFENAIWIM